MLVFGETLCFLLCLCCHTQRDISIINLESLSNNELRKLASLFNHDDWSDKCGKYGRVSQLHKGGPCTRKERESPYKVIRIWSDIKTCTKPLLTVLKSESRKETEDGLFHDGLKKLPIKI